MIKVIGVRFRTAGKIYFFDPMQFEIKKGDRVIVETARGIEFGMVVLGATEVEDEKVIQPLKPVIRIANEHDREQEAANKIKEKEAFKICLEKIHKHGLEMKLIDAEYTFDNNKVLFKQNLIIVKSVLRVNELHFQPVFMDFFQTDLKGFLLLYFVGCLLFSIMLICNTDHRLQGLDDLLILHLRSTQHNHAKLDPPGGFHDHPIALLYLKLHGIKEINLPRRAKSHSYNLDHLYTSLT